MDAKDQYITGFNNPEVTPKRDSTGRVITYVRGTRLKVGITFNKRHHVRVKGAFATEDRICFEDPHGKMFVKVPHSTDYKLFLDNSNVGALEAGTYCLQILECDYPVTEYKLQIVNLA